jgi:hypothetical protein
MNNFFLLRAAPHRRHSIAVGQTSGSDVAHMGRRKSIQVIMRQKGGLHKVEEKHSGDYEAKGWFT